MGGRAFFVVSWFSQNYCSFLPTLHCVLSNNGLATFTTRIHTSYRELRSQSTTAHKRPFMNKNGFTGIKIMCVSSFWIAKDAVSIFTFYQDEKYSSFTQRLTPDIVFILKAMSGVILMWAVGLLPLLDKHESFFSGLKKLNLTILEIKQKVHAVVFASVSLKRGDCYVKMCRSLICLFV